MPMLLWLVMACGASAADAQWQRAHFHYQLFCQGCHGPDGSGAREVPRMKDHIGVFLATPAARDYLVRVPGSATSALDDRQLAEVLNWIIEEFSGDSASDDFQRFTAEEVGRLRRHPLNEVADYRQQLLTGIASATTRE